MVQRLLFASIRAAAKGENMMSYLICTIMRTVYNSQ
jgi:hypothetical protein